MAKVRLFSSTMFCFPVGVTHCVTTQVGSWRSSTAGNQETSTSYNPTSKDPNYPFNIFIGRDGALEIWMLINVIACCVCLNFDKHVSARLFLRSFIHMMCYGNKLSYWLVVMKRKCRRTSATSVKKSAALNFFIYLFSAVLSIHHLSGSYTGL